MRGSVWLVMLVTALSALAWSRSAAAQNVDLHVASDEIVAGVPFLVVGRVEGFGEDQPEVSTLSVKGCTAELRGVSPAVQSMVSSINGRRTESRTVVFNYTWEVTCARPGRYAIEPLTARAA